MYQVIAAGYTEMRQCGHALFSVKGEYYDKTDQRIVTECISANRTCFYAGKCRRSTGH